MIPRKKRRFMIIITIVLLILIIATVLSLLYINTDMFKSNSTLFTKYLGQNVENVGAIYEQIGESEYNELLKQSNYTTQTEVKINYTENLGTSSESTQNSINQLRLEINGQTDNSNQYNYQDINLINNDENIAQVEYVQSGNTYGIKFSNMFNQYILANNENLKELFKKVGYTDEEVANIPDTIEFNNELDNIIKFSEEEKQMIKEKYINIINTNISKDKFSKQKNQVVQINGQNIQTNAYTLTLTKEQLNNIYIKVLEEVKQDEIILTKIDKMQEVLEKYQIIEESNLRELFIKEIEEIVANITRNNIGQDEAKITVYENDQIAIRTAIQSQDYEITIDVLSYQEEDYLQISYKDITNEKEKIFTYKNTQEEETAIFKNVGDEKTEEYSLLNSEKVEDNNCDRNIVLKYEDDSNRIEATIEEKISIGDSFENQVSLNDENSINLSELNEEQARAVMDQVTKGVSDRINEITTNIINVEDLRKLLSAIGLVEEQEVFEQTGVTETEKNRFNSKFEILQGEDLDADAILKLIDAIKENLINMEVISNTELRLELDRYNNNEEIATTLNAFIENNKNKKYNVKVEYDEETGLVSGIILTIVEK